MKRTLLVVALVLATIAIGGALLVHRLLYSEQGLQLIVSQLARVPGVTIEVDGATGTLAESLAADRVLIEHEAVRVELRGLRATTQLMPLLTGQVQLGEFVADGVEVQLREREAPPAGDTHFLPRFLSVQVESARLGPVGVTLTNGERIGVASVAGALRMTRWRIEVENLELRDPAGELDGALTLRASTPLGIRSALRGHWQLPDGHDYVFEAKTSGKLDRLAVGLALSAPAQLSYQGNVIAEGDTYRTSGVLRAEDFDGSPWLPGGSLPPLRGSVAVDLGPHAFGVDGTLDSTLFGDGPLRLQGGGRLREGGIELSALRLWLPRLSAELIAWGRIGLGGPAPVLDLQGEWTALQWPLAESGLVSSPYGRLSLRGELPYDYEIDGYVQPRDMPVASLQARGAIDRTELRVDALNGKVLDGTARGSGRYSWEGAGQWDLRVDARALDLSSLRSDLRGTLDVAGHAAGTGLGPEGSWTAQIDSFGGKLFGRPLTGRGRVSHAAGYYTLSGVRVASAGSHVDLGGRWGPVVDLEWDADLDSLAIIAPELAGSMVTSGRVRGAQARPEITAELRARDLVYGGLGADSAEASVDLDLSDGRSSRVEGAIRGGAAGTLGFDAITLRGEGLMADHRFRIEVSSTGTDDGRVAGFDAFLSASGLTDLVNRKWVGMLESARAEFPDGRAELIQPVALTVSPDQLDSAPLCLASDDARLCFEGRWQREPAAWQAFFSAQDWPLRRMLQNLLGWREFDGKLQASGWIAREPGRDWIGAATVLLDDPTLDIPRNKFRSERVELHGGRLDLFADAAEIRGNLDLMLVEGTTVQGRLSAVRVSGAPLAQSPLTGELTSVSSALNALPLFVPEIDRAAGRLDARLLVGGTVGSPQMTGEFRVFDARFDMYRTNLSLQDVTLEGRFVGDELSFAGSAGTGKGPLNLDGRFSWPGGIMTGSMRMWGSEMLVADTPEYRIFASPDLVLRAGPEGYDVEGTVEIPRARISPKDLSASVQTSADERVVGIDAERDTPSTLDRVRSRIRVVLGEDVRVDSYGLKARLAGDVTVSSQPDDLPRATGAIDIVEGEYKAFGQFVKITRGRLSYKNSPLNDPSLDIVAEREIKDEDVVVAVNVRGKLAEPFVTLSSTPAMPSNRALSYLLTGRSIDTLQSNQAGSVNRAAESLAISGGGMLLGAVGRRIGLDEVAVESRGTQDTEVVVGKYISPKLFVSYGVSIVEAINTIKLRYTINRKWSLKAEAGLQQSADVEYKIER